jgi:Zn-dependent peptidase ImmA (M78 family)
MHVRVHNPLYNGAGEARREEQHCTIDETLGLRPKVDWMEWQANYAGAALLMPLSRLVLTVGVCLGKGGIAPLADAPKANDLTQRVSEAFGVSAEAARVRLIQLGYLRHVSTD